MAGDSKLSRAAMQVTEKERRDGVGIMGEQRYHIQQHEGRDHCFHKKKETRTEMMVTKG